MTDEMHVTISIACALYYERRGCRNHSEAPPYRRDYADELRAAIDKAKDRKQD